MSDVDQSGRNVQLFQKLAEHNCVVRRLLAGLDNNCVPSDQRWSDLPCNQEEGKIPRQNSCNDTDGLSKEENCFPRSVTLNDFAFNPAPPLRHVVEVVSGKFNLYARQFQSLALLLGDDAGDQFESLADLLGDASEQFGPDHGGLLSPLTLCGSSCLNRDICIVVAAVGYSADGLTRRRIHDRNASAAGGYNKLSIDEVLKVFHETLRAHGIGYGTRFYGTELRVPEQQLSSTMVRSGSSPAYTHIMAISLLERLRNRCGVPRGINAVSYALI